jgi:hypothetical protein
VEEPLGQFLGLMVTHAWVAGEFVVDQADAVASDGDGEPDGGGGQRVTALDTSRGRPPVSSCSVTIQAALELLAGLAEPGGASVSRVAAYQGDATP